MSRIASLVAVADDIAVEPVEVSEWGVTINVKSMTGSERAHYMGRFSKAREEAEEGDEISEAMGRLEAELIVACAFDPEDNTKVFDPSDIDMLFTKSGAAIGRLSAAAMRVSGLTQASSDTLGKDSGSTPSAVSTSTSPAISE